MRTGALAIVAVVLLPAAAASAAIFQSGSPPDFQFYSDQAGARVGNSVARAGDVNGDGYGDVIIGGPRYHVFFGALDGAAWILLGSAAGITGTGPATADTHLLALGEDVSGFGASVAAAGDVNDDGYDDVIVGAPGSVNGASKAYVFLGGPSGIPSFGDPDTTLTSTGGGFGTSVAGAGDVNGDGYDDVIVGDPSEAFIFHGSSAGIADADSAAAATRIDSTHVTGDELGESVAGAGDINGDGYDDVIVASPNQSWFYPNEGMAHIFLGSASGVPSGTDATAHARISSKQSGAGNDVDVAGAGDVNNDGYDDVIIGYPYYDNGQVNEGVALLFHGSASGITWQGPGPADPGDADAVLESNEQLSGLGRTVAGAGDLNNDGYDDVVVAVQLFESEPGDAFVLLGSHFGILQASAAQTTASLETPYAQSVSGAGDVNGDGYDDAIVGAGYDSTGGTEAGAAFVYLGGVHATPRTPLPSLGPPGLVVLILLLAAAPFGLRRRAPR